MVNGLLPEGLYKVSKGDLRLTIPMKEPVIMEREGAFIL
jgi:hypothetical protein